MAVKVHKTRQHIHAFGVDLAGARFGAAIGRDWQARHADRNNAGDAPALNHNINRPRRRRASAVNQRRAANNQAFIRPLAERALGNGLRRSLPHKGAKEQ